jgi:hypothetical protein
MRIFLKISLLLLTLNVFAQSDRKVKHEIYFEVNLTRLVVQDYELQLLYRINDKIMPGVSLGFDLNRGEELFTDTKAAKDTAGWHSHGTNTSEGETNETSRYLFGKGPALRISCDFLKVNKKQRTIGWTAELLFKIRSYNNYYYQEYERLFLESASQQIFGISVLGRGYTKISNFLLLKISGGFGFRYLQSDVIRPGSYDYSYTYWHPEERFKYHLAFPMVNLGVSLVINSAGTGKPQIEK